MKKMSMSDFGILLFIFKILLISLSTRQTNALAVMSVDLGTEFMKIAIVKPGVPMEIVLNKESRRKTALIVSIKGTDREFGELALSRAVKTPKAAYFHLTQLLGKSFDNPTVKAYQECYPWYEIHEDPVTKTIYFQHDQETRYTPEELLAMILDYARDLAADFSEQSIDAAVLTVPAYFNQAERKAVLRAAEIANLKVLQLINSNVAAGLNYGVFRRKDFNSSGTNMMFFDMGSAGTTATVATFQMVKNKDDYEANPQVTVRGVGFDREIGGNAFTLRLAKHLAKLFKDQTKKDVWTSPKAIVKLYKEADRVKNILSANVDTFSQVEGLMDEVDFKAVKVTRDEFIKMCSDLFLGIDKVVQNALKSAEITTDELSQVILVGASTRIPKVQDELLKSTKKSDLGKNLNTDEAPALGAVYQAAFASKGYKVKKFYIKDTTLYPLTVDFERYVTEGEATPTGQSGIIRRLLFDKFNTYPLRKVMTFSRHTRNFGFNINYGDLSHLSAEYMRVMGSSNISQVSVTGVGEVFAKHLGEETKGIKVHFRLDESGILRLDKIDVTFEKSGAKTAETEESTFASSTISNFFGGGTKAETETTEEEKEKSEEGKQSDDKTTSTSDESQQESATTTPTTDSSTTTKLTTNQTVNGTESLSQKNQTANVTVLKENIQFEVADVDLIPFTAVTLEEYKAKLSTLKEKERERRKRAAAINSLETFIFDTKDKLTQEEFIKCSTDEERQSISAMLDETDMWLSETDDLVETKQFSEKLSDLKSVSRSVFYRIKERKQRPVRLDELKEVLNRSSHFLNDTRNMTGEDLPLTEVEWNSLDKLINSTKEWRVKMLNDQAKVADNEDPKLLSSDIADKADELKREVNYMLSKIKYFRPKKKAVTKASKTAAKDKEETPSIDDKETQAEEGHGEAPTNQEENYFENTPSNGDGEQAANTRDEQQSPKETTTTSNPEL